MSGFCSQLRWPVCELQAFLQLVSLKSSSVLFYFNELCQLSWKVFIQKIIKFFQLTVLSFGLLIKMLICGDWIFPESQKSFILTALIENRILVNFIACVSARLDVLCHVVTYTNKVISVVTSHPIALVSVRYRRKEISVTLRFDLQALKRRVLASLSSVRVSIKTLRN